MGIQKTLGGDRLGAGKKIKVDMHGWGRSTFNQSRVWRSTMAPGVLTPCFTEVGLNGTTFEIDINSLGHTLPTIAPLFGSFKLQVDFFACPIRLYQGLLHNNMLEIGLNMNKVLLPTIEIPMKYDQNKDGYIPEATCTSSLINYMGIKGIRDSKNEFNAVPILAYYDVFKSYYCNKQEENAKVIETKEVNKIGAPIINYYSNITPEGTSYEQNFKDKLKITQLLPNENDWAFTRFIQPDDLIELTNKTTEQKFEIIFDRNYNELNDVFIVLEIDFNGLKTNYPIKLKTKNGSFPIYLETNEEEDSQLYLGRYEGKNNILTIIFEKNLTLAEGFKLSIQNISYKDIRLDLSIVDFLTSNLDDARKKILAKTNYMQKIKIAEDGDLNFAPYIINAENGYTPLKSKELNGLLLKTYQNDIFNTWLSTEYVETINNLSSISPNPVTGEITIDAIILAKKVYNVLNRIAISGGTYEDWQESVYGEKAITRQESPLYIGGTSAEITFEEVVSTSQSSMEGVNQPLATLGGKGIMTNRKGGKVIYKCNEPCFIIGIASITPRIDYHQGNKWFMTDIFSMDNFHKPEFDGIGFQNLIENNVHWMGSPSKGLAKQTAWINYQTSFNEVFGYFAKDEKDDENSLAFMTLRRNYEVNEIGEITDFTSYVDPSKFNYAFAEPSLTAQNFWIQLGFNVESRRKMAAYEIPNL